ncbi:pleckstrin-like protein [Mycena floridula]|nr:pleckstrin-like protein [Mycena floridula]
MPPSAAAPSPQEIHRKLSVHSAPKSSKAGAAPVSGTESDSDSIISPEAPTTGTASIHTAPLSSIAERRDGSDSEEEDEEEEGGWKTAEMSLNHQSSKDESVIKAGYLWKKGERRKTWKKRWFVLRPAHLAFYKTAAEYQLLRLLELSDVHSCTQVNLKRHENTFGLISPVRTFYLQAKTSTEVQEWVAAIEAARQTLLLTSTQVSTASTPIPIPGSSRPLLPPLTPSPPYHAQAATSSDSEDASPGGNRPYSLSSQTRIAISSSPSRFNSVAPIDPTKIVLSGYLMKCGSKRRNWRKRWFVLTGEKLIYSASHMDTKPHRKFVLSEILDALEYDLPAHRQNLPPIPSSPPVPVTPDAEETHSDHTFKIVTTKRTLLLCAPGEEEEIKWLGAIRALIARRAGSGIVPGRSGAQAAAASTSTPNDASPSSSGFTSGGSSGLKPKVRRTSVSATGGSILPGVILEESAERII